MKFLSLVSGFLFLAATGVLAQTTNEIEGQKLVQDILQGTPTENIKQTGTLKIKDSKGTTNTPVTFDTALNTGYWTVTYSAVPTNSLAIDLVIIHKGSANKYLYQEMDSTRELNQTQIWAPFANSDFWIADLGLEFFHWPQQKVLKHESRRTRACTVLESTNPNPAPGAYSRVVTWIDNESHAIIYAEAYDVNNKLLKEFNPKKIKKVNGQWELEEMDIRNVQTRSRTWITFDLSGKS